MLDDCKKSCLPCGLLQPLRNNYFDGKLLVSRDFTDEQDYHRGHRQLHNALLHGTGTVCGLKLIEHPSEACRRDFVVVEPGMALDCCGQEIIVPKRALVRVADLLRNDKDLQAALDGSAHLFFAIERCDKGTELMPVILPGCEGQSGGEHGRIAEGYRFGLFAAKPDAVTPVKVPENPKLDWVHTFSYEGAVPKAVHVNEGEALLQVGVEDRLTARLLAYDRETHDLDALIGGSKTVSDTGSSREARLVFVAGAGFAGAVANGVGVWRAAGLGETPEPVRVIPTKGTTPRITVSPTSGTLYVLDINGTDSRLVSYSETVIEAYLDSGDAGPLDGQPSVAFGHTFGGASDAPGRGASMMEISRDGRFLALASPVGAAKERLYLIDTAKFREGGMAPEDARPVGYEPGATERVDLVKWSFDDAYLYVVSRESASSGTILLNRYTLIDADARLEKSGRGVKLVGMVHDFALAPTETRAYFLMADPAGLTHFTTVPLDLVKSQDAGAPPEVGLSVDAFRIDGNGRSLALTGNGTRIYAAAAETPEALPHRGLVAVIDIAEEDCGVHFLEAVDGCAACATDEHRVVLGHVEGYVWPGDGKDLPVMRNPEDKGSGDLSLDNFTFRPIVPSAATLKEVIECILEQGVAEGPPGPRGDPGASGKSVNQVEVTTLAPGQPATGAVADNGPGLTLRLGLPRGDAGANGKSVDQVEVTTLAPGQPATGAVVDNGPGLTLQLGIPKGEKGPPGDSGARPGIPVVALSWRHAEVHPKAPSVGAFTELMHGKGVAIAFGKEVLWPPFTGTERAGRSVVAEMEIPLLDDSGVMHWALPRLIAHPIADPQINGDLLEDWTVLDAARTTPGVCLRADPDTHFDLRLDAGMPFRVVLYADFAVTEDGIAVAGNFIGGKLPTGPSGGGDTFRSWFFFELG